MIDDVLSAKNPYLSPNSIEGQNVDSFSMRSQFAAKTLLLSTFAGVLLGALTNSINGLIYPWHFALFASAGTENLWRVAVLRGIVEGAIYGTLNGAVVAVVIIALRLPAARRPQSFKLVMTGSLFVFGAWLLGGLCALAIPLLGLKPTDNFYYDVGSGFWTGDRRWVLWSIRGAVWGSPVCSLATLALLLRRSMRKSPNEPAP